MYRGRLVVADAGGVLHWLDPATGSFLARAQVGSSVGRNTVITSKGVAYKKRVSSPPIVADGLVLAFTDNGVLSAFSAPLPVAAAASSAAPAEGAAAADRAR
jgi:outer membrane protein assembly factor BamB